MINLDNQHIYMKTFFFFKGALAIKKKTIIYNFYMIVVGYNGFTLVVCVILCFCPSVCLVHSEVSVSVEFHIMRFMSVYSVIVRLNLLCGIKNWYCGVKKDKRKVKGITSQGLYCKYVHPSVICLSVRIFIT